jgi:toxin ParE1/3/4
VDDLREIWQYIAQDNPTNADQFLASLYATMEALASHPLAGRRDTSLPAPLRCFPTGRYLVVYEPGEAGIDVARVLHGARDVPYLFET